MLNGDGDAPLLTDQTASEYFGARGLSLSPNIKELREQQQEAVEWALSRPEPYLLINAPTGSGKTALLGALGCELGRTWTYGVHTISLQNQVAKTFTNLPVLTGRRNHPCLIGEETHHRNDVHADTAICAAGAWCEFMGTPPRGQSPDEMQRWEEHPGGLCDYYAQRNRALQSPHRVVNYAMLLADHRSLVGGGKTDTLLGDEAHNIEEAVCNASSLALFRPSYTRFGLDFPATISLRTWAQWARESLSTLPPGREGDRSPPDFAYKTVKDQLLTLSSFTEQDEGKYLVSIEKGGLVQKFEPIWGKSFVMKRLLGHDHAPSSLDEGGGVRRAVFTSATLLGAEFVRDSLGLPAESTAYLDLPSTFGVSHRPINYAPVVKMSASATEADHDTMIKAIDAIIGYYLANGRKTGIIHAVSNKYRDEVLTTSRWRAMMTVQAEEHEKKVEQGLPSVIVSANMTEGWDGVDDLCRFVIIPKVPYPNLGDKRTALRMKEDPRSYDWRALVAVVQGAGRGVRHAQDYADTWILDKNWGDQLYRKRHTWLPESFKDAYHHNVGLPR